MKNLLTTILILFTLSLYSQDRSDESYGDTWLMIYQARNEKDAKRLIQRYENLVIHNTYFEEDGVFYVVLTDPSDYYEKNGGYRLYNWFRKRRIFYQDYLIGTNGECILTNSGEKIPAKY